ncbi:MAG: DUF721 domain-containing protein [Verrucomicrobiota bacterium JB023]|nr:DUF721 domain-containing protein [Verrucomicrobiota bacterium JB023]
MKRSKSRGDRSSYARWRMLREWRLGDEPSSTEKNSSQAKDWVGDILGGLKLSEGLEEGAIQEGWSRIAGDFIASQTQVVSLRHGILMLRVLQPAMRFHLEQSRGHLLAKLKEELGAEKIRDVKLVTG